MSSSDSTTSTTTATVPTATTAVVKSPTTRMIASARVGGSADGVCSTEVAPGRAAQVGEIGWGSARQVDAADGATAPRTHPRHSARHDYRPSLSSYPQAGARQAAGRQCRRGDEPSRHRYPSVPSSGGRTGRHRRPGPPQALPVLVPSLATRPDAGGVPHHRLEPGLQRNIRGIPGHGSRGRASVPG